MCIRLQYLKVPAAYARCTFMYYLNEPILPSYLHQARVHENDAWVHNSQQP